MNFFQFQNRLLVTVLILSVTGKAACSSAPIRHTQLPLATCLPVSFGLAPAFAVPMKTLIMLCAVLGSLGINSTHYSPQDLNQLGSNAQQVNSVLLTQPVNSTSTKSLRGARDLDQHNPVNVPAILVESLSIVLKEFERFPENFNLSTFTIKPNVTRDDAFKKAAGELLAQQQAQQQQQILFQKTAMREDTPERKMTVFTFAKLDQLELLLKKLEHSIRRLLNFIHHSVIEFLIWMHENRFLFDLRHLLDKLKIRLIDAVDQQSNETVAPADRTLAAVRRHLEGITTSPTTIHLQL